MAQVQSQTKNAKEELAAKGGTATKAQSTDLVPTIKANALSLDIGPKVIGILDRSLSEQGKATELLMSAQGKKYEAMSLMTQAIVKLAINDPSVKLSAAFSGDKKLVEHLNKQIGLGLGFREVQTQVDGEKTVQRVVMAKTVARYFPGVKEDTKSEEYQRKNTFRANFMTSVKTCAQAAEGIILSKAKVEMDAAAGTLRLTGPKIKETFGVDSILLNESTKQGENTLSAKPSFTAIRALAGEEHDAPVHRGTNTRGATIGASAPKAVDPDTIVTSLAHSLIQGIGKYDGPLSAKVREALNQVVNAINEKMKVTV